VTVRGERDYYRDTMAKIGIMICNILLVCAFMYAYYDFWFVNVGSSCMAHPEVAR
jgi:hypothetical protein